MGQAEDAPPQGNLSGFSGALWRLLARHGASHATFSHVTGPWIIELLRYTTFVYTITNTISSWLS